MWFQRSRAKWLADGDRNTKYYQLKTVTRRRKNQIKMIKDDDGNWIEDDEQIRRMTNQYYRNLFMERCDLVCWRNTAISYPPVQNEELSVLDNMVSHEEIKKAMYEMKPWKAPGLDGFPAGFYQSTWDVVGDNVTTYIQKVWETPELIGRINLTDICLIPKVDHPTTIMQFRLFHCVTQYTRLLAKLWLID